MLKRRLWLHSAKTGRLGTSPQTLGLPRSCELNPQQDQDGPFVTCAFGFCLMHLNRSHRQPKGFSKNYIGKNTASLDGKGLAVWNEKRLVGPSRFHWQEAG